MPSNAGCTVAGSLWVSNPPVAKRYLPPRAHLCRGADHAHHRLELVRLAVAASGGEGRGQVSGSYLVGNTASGRAHTSLDKVAGTVPDVDALAFKAMNSLDQVLLDKIKQLPPQRMAGVEDFVDFLRAREVEKRLTLAAAKASEASFARVWDNDEDAAYDRI